MPYSPFQPMLTAIPQYDSTTARQSWHQVSFPGSHSKKCFVTMTDNKKVIHLSLTLIIQIKQDEQHEQGQYAQEKKNLIELLVEHLSMK